MVFLVYIPVCVIGYLLVFHCGTIGMILGAPILLMVILADAQDLEFWRKTPETIEEDFF